MTPTDYQKLIQAFLDRQLPVEEFESRYLAAVKAEPGGMDPVLYEIVEDLFGAVDTYSPECSSGEETPVVISEASLRREAREALDRLEQYTQREVAVVERP